MWAALIAAIGLTTVHVLAGRLQFLHVEHRSRWLSIAGGASVAYVFVHVLPELDKHQEHLSAIPAIAFVQHHVYLVALVGFATFYGLERLAQRSRRRDAPKRTGPASPADEQSPPAPPAVFWTHVLSFGAYNALIGYLLIERASAGTWSLVLFAVALGLHLLVNDDSLHEHHQHRYQKFGRWLLSLAILLGWGVGAVWDVSQAMLAVLFALIAGGVILNAIKEELPGERESRWWAFVAGATVYTLLLLCEGWMTDGESGGG